MEKKSRARTREAVVRAALTKIEIDNETDCWLWTAGRSSQYAYPYTWLENTAVPVHKLLYEHAHGELPKIAEDGTRVELHHDRELGCKGRSAGCVNPGHLRVLSARQHGQISAMERALGLQEPKPPRRPRRRRSTSLEPIPQTPEVALHEGLVSPPPQGTSHEPDCRP